MVGINTDNRINNRINSIRPHNVQNNVRNNIPNNQNPSQIYCYFEPIINQVQISYIYWCINEYINAKKALDGAGINTSSIKPKDLSENQKKIYDNYILAINNLEKVAREFFELAFIKKDQAGKNKLDIFLNKYVNLIYNVDDPLLNNVNFFVFLSMADLFDDDRILLYKFATEKKYEFWDKIKKKYISYLKKRSNYNGWQSQSYFKKYDVFLILIEAFYPKSVKAILKKNLFSVFINKNEAQSFLKMDKKKFNEEYIITMKEAMFFPVGSNQKINAEKRLRDLYVIAFVKGFDLESIFFNGKSLDKEDYSKMMKFYFLVQISDSTKVKHELFTNIIEYFKKRIENSDINSDERISLLDFLSSFIYYLALLLKCPIEELVLLYDLSFKKTDYREVKTMSELKDLGDRASNVTVQVDGLPSEVIKILKDTKYYDLVKQNVKEIIFVPEIYEEDPIIDTMGIAFSPLGIVEVDFVNPDGGIISAFQIALVLVHEAAHIKFERELTSQNILLLQPTPNERNAFLIQLKFCETYLKQGLEKGLIKQNSIEEKEIRRLIAVLTTLVKNSNKILGYSLDNMETDYFVYPPIDFLKSHGLNSADELDLSYYPSILDISFVDEHLDELINGLAIQDKDKDLLKNLLIGILNGEITLEVSFFKSNIPKSNISNVKIFIVYKNGKKRLLTKKEKELLEKLIDNLFPDPKKEEINLLEFLFNFYSNLNRPIEKFEQKSYSFRFTSLDLYEALSFFMFSN